MIYSDKSVYVTVDRELLDVTMVVRTLASGRTLVSIKKLAK